VSYVIGKVEKKRIMSEEKSIRVLQFSGKAKHWEVWKTKFEAKADKNGYGDVLEGKFPKDPNNITDAEKAMNKACYNELVLSITNEDRVLLNILRNAKSTAFPKKCASTAWTKLVEKFETKSQAGFAELKQEYDDMYLKPGQDPEEWLTELSLLKTRLEEDFKVPGLDGKSFLLHIMTHLSRVEALQQWYLANLNRIGASANPLTYEEIDDYLKGYHDLDKRNKNGNGKIKSHEQALIVQGQIQNKGKQRFNGECFNCHKRGHRKDDCRAPGGGAHKQKNGNNNGNRKFLKCTYCNKSGHVEEKCWKKKADEKEEEANVEIGRAHV